MFFFIEWFCRYTGRPFDHTKLIDIQKPVSQSEFFIKKKFEEFVSYSHFALSDQGEIWLENELY